MLIYQLMESLHIKKNNKLYLCFVNNKETIANEKIQTVSTILFSLETKQLA